MTLIIGPPDHSMKHDTPCCFVSGVTVLLEHFSETEILYHGADSCRSIANSAQSRCPKQSRVILYDHISAQVSNYSKVI